MAGLPRDCVGRNDARLCRGLLHKRPTSYSFLRSETRQWKAWAEKIVVEEAEGGPWLAPEKSVVLKTDIGQVVSTASGAAFSVVCHWRMEGREDFMMLVGVIPKTCLHSGQEGAGCPSTVASGLQAHQNERMKHAVFFVCGTFLRALFSSVDRSG